MSTMMNTEKSQVVDPRKSCEETVRSSVERKTFAKPELIRHESLPEVTTGFVASFQP